MHLIGHKNKVVVNAQIRFRFLGLEVFQKYICKKYLSVNKNCFE